MKARRRKPQVRQLLFLEQRLTPKYIKILDLLCRGYSQKEIAVELKGSLRAIEADLRLVRARLACRTTGQAIAIFAVARKLRVAGITA